MFLSVQACKYIPVKDIDFKWYFNRSAHNPSAKSRDSPTIREDDATEIKLAAKHVTQNVAVDVAGNFKSLLL